MSLSACRGECIAGGGKGEGQWGRDNGSGSILQYVRPLFSSFLSSFFFLSCCTNSLLTISPLPPSFSVDAPSCPCLRCTVKIVQCGVTQVVYSLSYSMDAASRRVMEEAGIELRQIVQPPFPR